jgi:hypothetical protein
MIITVCELCKWDRLGMCSDYEASQGFDAYCFDCERPIIKIDYDYIDNEVA